MGSPFIKNRIWKSTIISVALLAIVQIFGGWQTVNAANGTNEIVQPAGVGDPSWPAKCPTVIDSVQTEQPKVAGFTFEGTKEVFLRLVDGGSTAVSDPANLIGCYADFSSLAGPTPNGYHIGTISRDSTGFYWQNAAGVRWGLTLSGNVLITDKNNPYYSLGNRFVIIADANLKYFTDHAIGGSNALTGGPGYYVTAPVSETIPTSNRSGFGWYSSLFPLLANPSKGFQVGLSSTWIEPNISPRLQTVAQELCKTGTDQWVKNAASDPANGTYGYDLFQTIEGSLGWWLGEKYPSVFPKYEANVTQNCYTSQLATPGWSFFGGEPTPRDSTGLVQLTNQVLLPPDGMTFQESSKVPQLGVSWLALPLPTFDHAYSNMSGKNAWTLFMNTGNFSGPLQFVAPQFWADGSTSNPIQNGLTLDKNLGFIGELSSEWNSIPFYEDKGADGATYSKIPAIQLPSDQNSQLVFSRDLVAYSNDAFLSPVATSLLDNSTLPTVAKSSTTKSIGLRGLSTPAFQHGESIPYLDKLLTTTALDSGSAFGLSLPSANTIENLPQYYVSKNGMRVPAELSAVPQALKDASFDVTNIPTYIYQSPDWWKASVPASETFSAQLSDGSSVDYKWYKFIDQPSLQRFELNDSEKSALQSAAEKIQKEWAYVQVMKNPTSGSLVNLDSGLLVAPPAGLEIGYVPIVTKQYFGAPQFPLSAPPPHKNSSAPTPTATPTITHISTPVKSPIPSKSAVITKKVLSCVTGKKVVKMNQGQTRGPSGYKLKK